MSPTDQPDPVIRSALDAVDVPDYEPGFWDRLDDRLEQDDTPQRARPNDEQLTVDDRRDFGDHPDVTELRRPATPRRNLTRLAALAAAVALLFLANRAPVGDSGVRTASPPEGTESTGTTTAPAPSVSAPEAAVLRWLDAIAAGDIDDVVGLTGPHTIAYFEALGADMRGVALEWGEGYGGWTDVADRSTEVVPLGEVDGVPVAVVVISGTWTGEGEDGYRTEAIPAVQDPDGQWRAEPAAYDPDRESRIELTSPPPGETGFGTISRDGVIEISSSGRGAYYFAVDGAEPTRVPAAAAGAGLRFDPPGALDVGSHLLFIAQVDDQYITAQTLTFTVE